MKYSKLVETYERLEETTKRLKKTEIIANLLKETPEDKLEEVLYLLQGRVFSKWDERKVGMSSRLMIKAINSSTGVSPEKIEKEWARKGDLGLVVEDIIGHKKQLALFSKKLTVEKVFENIQKLASLEGPGTVSKKIKLVTELLTSAKTNEAKFIAKTVVEDLRIGVQDGVIRDSIAQAFLPKKVEIKEFVKKIEDAYNLTNDFSEVAIAAKKRKLKSLVMNIDKPINPMLAIKVESAEEGLKAVGSPAQAEYKLDGFRLQIHKKGEEVILFTRRLENVTKQFQDVIPRIRKNVKIESCILDSELIGYDPKSGKYLPFQNISQRIKRKYHLEKTAEKIPVEINVFDIINKNGKSLMDLSQKERRKILEKNIKEKKKEIVLVKRIVTDDAKKIEKFYKESLGKGNEGIMMKNYSGCYVPGRRVAGWVKLKPVKESLDLVVTGAEWGEGKRVKWLASFTLSCRNGNSFLEIGKVGTGIKEKDSELTFKELTRILKPKIKSEKGKCVSIKPYLVLEISYEEIQKSKNYSSGYALRFPRVLKIRNDLSIKDVDNLIRVKKFYDEQTK
ncbi:ATP-dependent DNA ligase [archaeon]|nr:ATP-dependent DNA ligase [archaeon]